MVVFIKQVIGDRRYSDLVSGAFRAASNFSQTPNRLS